MDSKVKKHCSFQTPISVSFVVAFAALFFCGLFHRIWILPLLLVASLVINIYSHASHAHLARKGEYTFTGADRYTVIFLVAVYGLTFASAAAYALRMLAGGGSYLLIICTFIAAFWFFGFFIFETIFLCRMPREKEKIPFKQRLISALPILALCSVLLLLNLENFDAWLRWDSYEYFYYIRRLSLTDVTSLDAMRLANHGAYICSVAYMLLGGIFGSPEISAYVLNILVLIVGTLMFWRITSKFLPKEKWILRLIVTAIYAFSPFTHGMAYNISLESFLMFGLLMFFWGEAEKMPAMQVLASLIICFSKETGAVILAVIMVTRLILNFLPFKDKSRSVLEKLELSLSLPVLACGLLWLVDFISFSWISSNNNSATPTVDGMSFNAFSLNFTYIKDRFLSLVFSNFTWLIIALVVAGFIVGTVLKKHEKPTKEKNAFIIQCVAGLAASLIPLFFFVTYNHIRYCMSTVVFLLILIPVAVERLAIEINVRRTLCTTLAILSLLQCYFTIDPTMYMFFKTIDKGFGKMTYVHNSVLTNYSDSLCIGVHSQYNREILYYDRAFEQVLKDVGYTSKDCILISPEYMEPTVGGYVTSEYLITGDGYKYRPDRYYVSYDENKNDLYLSSNTEKQLNIYYIGGTYGISELIDTYDRVIYIQMPFRDTSEESFENRVLGKFSWDSSSPIAKTFSHGWIIKSFQIK